MMNLVLICIGLCAGSLPLAVSASDQHATAFDPSGYFLPIDSQGNSSHVRWILLSDFHGRERAGPLYVELRTGSRSQWTTFSQASLQLNGRDLQFATKQRKGRWYDFKGTFYPTERDLSSGAFTEDPHGRTVVLRGVLRCFRGSTLVRSDELAFLFTDGD